MEKLRTVNPEELFLDESAAERRPWTCVRTRPNWEKRFARWLLGRGYRFFLPTFERETNSGGKRRVSQLPLIPGYLFVEGNHTKRVFVDSNSVVRVLKPTTERGVDQLHLQLWNIWKTLQTTSPVELAQPLKPGHDVEITAGPLKGVVGQFRSWKKQGILILNVDMLGTQVAFEIPDSCTVVAEDGTG